jgi:Xaa-Pro aminopeptidase
MNSAFTAEFFRDNRRRLREAIGSDAPVVITANGLLQRSADTTFPFQQDAGFWYLTGIDEPDIILVMEAVAEYLIVPGRDPVREAFDGAVKSAELTRLSGIGEVLAEREGWQRLGALARQSPEAAVLAANPVRMKFFGIYTNPARRLLQARLRRQHTALKLVDIRPQLARLRMVKQPLEIQAIQRAIDVTVDTITEAAAPAKLSSYQYEYELEAALSHGFRRRGARGHAFDPIVASGKSAATIHSLKNDGELEADTLVVMDVGAAYDHYAADITRTVAYGKPSARQAAVFAAVLSVQNQVLERLKPGLLIRDNERQVEQEIGRELLQLGLITKNDRASVRRYYQHACSHSLGLDLHDAADYTQPLQPGMVLTVEPGIYIPEESIGVRIEDDVLITENGIEILSRRLPRSLSLTE